MTPAIMPDPGVRASRSNAPTKRHNVVNSLGLLLVVLVTTARAQDRDGGRRALQAWRWSSPNGGYADRMVRWAKGRLHFVIEVVG